MKKYILSSKSIIPIYPVATKWVPSLNIQNLPIDCQLLDKQFIDAYFEDIKSGKNVVIHIDHYNTLRYNKILECCQCGLIIDMSHAYFYHNEQNYCIECGNASNNKNTNNDYKLRVNYFKLYNCDFCNTLILDFQFYHNRLLNFDICTSCSITDNVKNVLKLKNLKCIDNNIFDPIGYTFGSILEWVPIISLNNIKTTTNSNVLTKLVLQHYCQNRFAIYEQYSITENIQKLLDGMLIHDININIIAYKEINCKNITDLLCFLNNENGEQTIINTDYDDAVSIDI